MTNQADFTPDEIQATNIMRLYPLTTCGGLFLNKIQYQTCCIQCKHQGVHPGSEKEIADKKSTDAIWWCKQCNELVQVAARSVK